MLKSTRKTSRKTSRKASRKSTLKSRSKSRSIDCSGICLKKSTKNDKKFMVIINDRNGKSKTIHFGAAGYSDYTIHKTDDRKERYINRHKRKENWGKSGIKSAGFWSRWILWNKPTLTSSIKHTENKFGIKIKKL